MLKAVFDDVLRQTVAGLRRSARGLRAAAARDDRRARVRTWPRRTAPRTVTPLALALFRFDRFASRSGLTVVLRKGGITRAPSAAVPER